MAFSFDVLVVSPQPPTTLPMDYTPEPARPPRFAVAERRSLYSP